MDPMRVSEFNGNYVREKAKRANRVLDRHHKFVIRFFH